MRRPSTLLKSTKLSAPAPASETATPSAPATYLDHYGLSKPPFGEAQDSAGYILFGSQRRAFELLTDHIVRGTGVILLHGEEGIGKTETLRAAASVAAESGRQTILLTRPADGRLSLAQLMSDLDGQRDAGTTANDQGVATALASPKRVLLADDIDLLPDDCAHLLLSLAQAIPADAAGPALVCSHSADLAALSNQPNLAQLVSLARNTIRLSPLAPSESRQYIERSLWIAGGTTRRLITQDAMKLLIARSGGVPRTINRFMEAAFTTGFARGDVTITAKTVAAAMGPIAARPGHRPDASSGVAGRLIQIAAAGLLAAGAAAFLYKGMNDHIDRPSTASPRPVTLPALVAAPPEQPQAAASPETISPELVAALMKRGEQSLALGDIAAARLLFERATVAGDAAAATALGKTYDPNFVALGGKPDAAIAAAWYRKAIALGNPRAATLIQRLSRP